MLLVMNSDATASDFYFEAPENLAQTIAAMSEEELTEAMAHRFDGVEDRYDYDEEAMGLLRELRAMASQKWAANIEDIVLIEPMRAYI